MSFNFQPLIVPFSVNAQTISGSVLLTRGDVLESVTISAELGNHTQLGGFSPSAITVRVLADNNKIATGPGISLPTQSRLELIPTTNLPWTSGAAAVAAFDPVAGTTTSFEMHQSFYHVIPIYLLVDESSRDIIFQLDPGADEILGYICFNIRRNLQPQI